MFENNSTVGNFFNLYETINISVTETNSTSSPSISSTFIYNNDDNNNNNNDDDNSTLTNKFLIAGKIIGHYLSYYYTPILVLTGSIGNILSVFVFFKTKLNKLSSSYYLAALAVSDTCFLFGLFIQWLNFIDINYYNYEIFCQFFTFLSNLCSFLSVWFVVAFTVERFIAVMYPLKRQTMCTVKRAKIVLGGLTLLGTIHCTPFLYFAIPIYDFDTNSTICDIRSEYKDYMTILNYIDTLIVFVVPFTTIVILNTFTGCTVWKFATVRRTLTMHKRKPTIATTQFSKTSNRRSSSSIQKRISNCTHPNGKNNILYTSGNPEKISTVRRKIKNSSQIKVTKMLLIVSTVFVCLNLPSYLIRIQIYLEPNPSDLTIVIQYICSFLFSTNFGINFVLYCVSGQNFRRAVISLFRKGTTLSSQRDGTTQVTVSEYIRNSGIRTSRRRTVTQTGSWTDIHELKHVMSFKETKKN